VSASLTVRRDLAFASAAFVSFRALDSTMNEPRHVSIMERRVVGERRRCERIDARACDAGGWSRGRNVEVVACEAGVGRAARLQVSP